MGLEGDLRDANRAKRIPCAGERCRIYRPFFEHSIGWIAVGCKAKPWSAAVTWPRDKAVGNKAIKCRMRKSITCRCFPVHHGLASDAALQRFRPKTRSGKCCEKYVASRSIGTSVR